MLNEPPFSTTEGLQLFQEMIGKAKRSYVSKGIASIVWGSLIVLCSLLSWAEAQFNFKIVFDVWILLIIALVPQAYFTIKEKNQKDFVAHDEHTITFVWIAFAISIFITSFYNSKFGGESAATLTMMLFGIPTFITGGIVKFKPMIAGGIICYILSIVSIYSSFSGDMLLMAACGLFAWLIPGIILWKRYKKQQADV